MAREIEIIFIFTKFLPAKKVLNGCAVARNKMPGDNKIKMG